MDVSIIVEKQMLLTKRTQLKFTAGTQNFIRFVFEMSDEWAALSYPFVQFKQGDTVINSYLDEDNSAYLPSGLSKGLCYMALQAMSADKSSTVAETFWLKLVIDEASIASDGSSTEISVTLYEQMIENIAAISDAQDALEARVASLEAYGASDETITENINAKIDELLADGSLANMTIEDGSITQDKIDSDFSEYLDSLDSYITDEDEGTKYHYSLSVKNGHLVISLDEVTE